MEYIRPSEELAGAGAGGERELGERETGERESGERERGERGESGWGGGDEIPSFIPPFCVEKSLFAFFLFRVARI